MKKYAVRKEEKRTHGLTCSNILLLNQNSNPTYALQNESFDDYMHVTWNQVHGFAWTWAPTNVNFQESQKNKTQVDVDVN